MYQAFVINLAKRVDRWDQIAGHITKRSKLLKLVRFPALEGTPGWKYCALSHLALVRRAKAERRPYLIVMEDDNRIIPPTLALSAPENKKTNKQIQKQKAFDSVFGELMKALLKHKKDWDIFNGGPSWCSKNPNQNVTVLNRSPKIVRYQRGQCANFVIYNSSSYDRVLSLEPRYWPISGNSQMDYEKNAYDILLCQLGLRLTTSLPYLFSQRNGWSDIINKQTNYDRAIIERGESVLIKACSRPQNKFDKSGGKN